MHNTLPSLPHKDGGKVCVAGPLSSEGIGKRRLPTVPSNDDRPELLHERASNGGLPLHIFADSPLLPRYSNRRTDAVLSQAAKITTLGLIFRPGIRHGTRECVMTRYPYTLVYRIGPRRIEIIRVIHQRSEYFQRRR